MNPSVSVILPVYNTAQYLAFSIDSILQQTFSDFELIIVDDGSTDNSGTIAENYRIKDNRITVIHTENRGLSSARNIGLANSSGKYISFVDSDDFIDIKFLEILVKELEENESDIAVVKYKEVYDHILINSQPNNYNTNTVTKNDYLLGIYTTNSINYIVSWNKLYKRHLFNDVLFPLGKLHEDEFTTYKLVLCSDKITIIDVPLYYYFTNLNGITKSKYSIKRLDIIEALEERISYFKLLNNPKLVTLAEENYYRTLLKTYYLVKQNIANEKDCLVMLRYKIKNMNKSLNSNKFSFKFNVIRVISYVLPYFSGYLLIHH